MNICADSAAHGIIAETALPAATGGALFALV
jgi:hypothetical protein